MKKLLGLAGKYAIECGKASLFGDEEKAKKYALKLKAVMAKIEKS
jgi:hypothetical protein